MEELFKQLAESVALGVEAAATLIIAAGAIEAMIGSVRCLFAAVPHSGRRKAVWLRFATWLMLGLEFELAADVIRTAIAPSWTDIGQLAAIGAIRTALNYFLEEDLDEFAASEISMPSETPSVGATSRTRQRVTG
jgi:uncharacterized membrane protein